GPIGAFFGDSRLPGETPARITRVAGYLGYFFDQQNDASRRVLRPGIGSLMLDMASDQFACFLGPSKAAARSWTGFLVNRTSVFGWHGTTSYFYRAASRRNIARVGEKSSCLISEFP